MKTPDATDNRIDRESHGPVGKIIRPQSETFLTTLIAFALMARGILCLIKPRTPDKSTPPT